MWWTAMRASSNEPTDLRDAGTPSPQCRDEKSLRGSPDQTSRSQRSNRAPRKSGDVVARKKSNCILAIGSGSFTLACKQSAVGPRNPSSGGAGKTERFSAPHPLVQFWSGIPFSSERNSTLAQPHMNGLTVLACVMVAAVFAVEYCYTLSVCGAGTDSGRR